MYVSYSFGADINCVVSGNCSTDSKEEDQSLSDCICPETDPISTFLDAFIVLLAPLEIITGSLTPSITSQAIERLYNQRCICKQSDTHEKENLYNEENLHIEEDAKDEETK